MTDTNSISHLYLIRLSFPRMRESMLINKMDTRLRGYDIALTKFTQ
ncbi:hypothetical protein [Candidatus Leptofilum sp.]